MAEMIKKITSKEGSNNGQLATLEMNVNYVKNNYVE